MQDERGGRSAWRRARQALLAGALGLMVALSAAPALASTTDSTFNFNLRGQGDTHGTAGRKKDTNSSCYVYIKKLTTSGVHLYVDGAVSAGSAYTNQTTNGVAIANHTGQYLIHNTVYENACRYARLTSWSPSGSSTGTISGVWSPDTSMTGKLPYLN